MVSHLKDFHGFCANVIQEAAMAGRYPPYKTHIKPELLRRLN
jgi:hypothetical protein